MRQGFGNENAVERCSKEHVNSICSYNSLTLEAKLSNLSFRWTSTKTRSH